MATEKQEFLRPFTEEELRRKFLDMNLLEESFPHLMSLYKEKMEVVIDEIKDLGLENAKEEPDLVEILKDLEWTANNLREEALTRTLRDGKPDLYIKQLRARFSHEWAHQYALNYVDNKLAGLLFNNRLYDEIYQEVKEIDKEKAKKDLENLIKISCGDSDPACDKFLRNCIYENYDSIDDSLRKLNSFKKIYPLLIKEGLMGEEKAFQISKDLVNDYTDQKLKPYWESFYELTGAGKSVVYSAVYSRIVNKYDHYYSEVYAQVVDEASKNSDRIYDAVFLAKFISDHILDSRYGYETDTFKKTFKKEWQRELYYKLILKNEEDIGESISTIFTVNYYREQLELPPLDIPLTIEDEEFLKYKEEFIKSGLIESIAEMRAYKKAYGLD